MAGKINKIAIPPRSSSKMVPRGTIIESFKMNIFGSKVRVAVIEVPAKMLATSTVKGALRTCCTAVPFARDVVYPIANGGGCARLSNGDVAVYVSKKFGSFSKRARQVICAYEGAKAAALYMETVRAISHETFANQMIVEEAATQYLASLDFGMFSTWKVFHALKKFGNMSMREQKRFYKYAKKNSASEETDSFDLFDDNDLELLDELSA